MKRMLGMLLLLAASLCAQTAAPLHAQTAPATAPKAAPDASPDPAPDPWKSLSFLEGTWEAKGQGPGGVASSGSYTFQMELDKHVLARHSTTDAGCKGPVTFDCAHGDLLYVYADGPGQPLKAIYFDNEGHVLHYALATPDAISAVFMSDASAPGPRFRLVYELKGAVMYGKFQMQIPGQSDWKSYLEWSGAKK